MIFSDHFETTPFLTAKNPTPGVGFSRSLRPLSVRTRTAAPGFNPQKKKPPAVLSGGLNIYCSVICRRPYCSSVSRML